MATTTFDMNDLKRRMQGAIGALKQEMSGLRTGRASTALLDHVQVEAYGTHMPLNQLARAAFAQRPGLGPLDGSCRGKSDLSRQSRFDTIHRGTGSAPAHSRA